MKRFGLFGLLLALFIFGGCNDNGGGSGFGIPDDLLGQVTITIGTDPSCQGGTNDGTSCSPYSDCPDGFCTLQCSGTGGDSGTPCTSDAQCTFTCELACDRGANSGQACDFDTDCTGGGVCTTALIHSYDAFFTYDGDPFAAIFSGDTDGDNDGFTPARVLENAPSGGQGEIMVDFLDDVADCVDITWGPQQVPAFNACGDPIDSSFAFP
jgi:hypothetical protein